MQIVSFRNEITEHTGYAKVELEHLMSWLSTLGGGYSALGDSMDTCVNIVKFWNCSFYFVTGFCFRLKLLAKYRYTN